MPATSSLRRDLIGGHGVNLKGRHFYENISRRKLCIFLFQSVAGFISSRTGDDFAVDDLSSRPTLVSFLVFYLEGISVSTIICCELMEAGQWPSLDRVKVFRNLSSAWPRLMFGQMGLSVPQQASGKENPRALAR